MAQLALSVVGAGVGFAIGGPLGAQIGWAAGSLAGGLLFAPDQEGPRLSDLKAPGVAYGSVIAYIEGHPRIAGSIVWASDKRESANDVEGKGSGGSATSYTYSIDILIMMSENVVNGPRRVWLNGKLVYTAAADADGDSLSASSENEFWEELIFYPGGSSQLPDPTYEAAVGVGNAPAYRGRSTIMIKGLQLGTSGQLPVLTFEMSGGAGDPVTGETKRILDDFAPAKYRANPPEGSSAGAFKVIANQANSIKTFNSNGTVDTRGIPDLVYYGPAGSGNGDRAISVFGINAAPCVVGWAGDGIDPVTVEIDDTFGYLGTTEIRFSTFGGDIVIGTTVPVGGGGDQDQTELMEEFEGGKGTIYLYSLDGTFIGKKYIGLQVDPLSSIAMNNQWVYVCGGGSVWGYDRSNALEYGAVYALPGGSDHRIFIAEDGKLACANAGAEIYRLIEGEWVLYCTMDDAVDEDGPVDLGTNSAHHTIRNGYAYAVVYEEKELDQAITVTKWVLSGEESYPELYRDTPEQVLYEYAFVRGGRTPDLHAVGAAYSFYWGDVNGVYGQRPSFYHGYAFNGTWTAEGVVNNSYTHSFTRFYSNVQYPGDFDDPGYYPITQETTVRGFEIGLNPGDPDPNKYVDVWRKAVEFNLYELDEPTLQEVVERQCVRAGLSLDDIDASDLATRNVRCMAVSQITSPRQVIENLMAAYFFTCQEGEKLVFKFRGKDPVATIPYDDLGADGNEPFPRTKVNDLELPSQVNVRYCNVDDDYQDGNENSDRLISVGQSIASIETPIGFTPLEAKTIATTSVLDPVASGIRVGPIALTRKYSHLQAGDVVLIVDRDGSVYRVRFTRLSLQNGIYVFEGVTDDASVLTPEVSTSSDGYTNSTTLVPNADTVLELLDIPMLRDADDGPGHYAAVKGTSARWSGAAVYRSVDNENFVQAASIDRAAVIGATDGVLGDWTGGNTVDYENVLRVSVGLGQLSSVTRDTMLNGPVNAALVGDEVIQFAKATLVSDGVYDLQDMLRGRLGTEWAIPSHGDSERFVLLSSLAVQHIETDLSEINSVRYYKGVTFGRRIGTATSNPFTNTGVSQKPWAPVDIRGDRDTDDLVITWARRSRRSINFLAGAVPLGEESEQYSIEIYSDDSNEALLRTLTSNTQTVTYTMDMQAEDFGSDLPSSVLVKVYQLSASVGRGYAGTAVI